MADKISLQCVVADCPFSTQELPTAVATNVLQMHVNAVHPLTASHGGGGAGTHSKMEKISRPVVKLSLSQDQFEFFCQRWESYLRSTGLSDSQMVKDQLVEC